MTVVGHNRLLIIVFSNSFEAKIITPYICGMMGRFMNNLGRVK